MAIQRKTAAVRLARTRLKRLCAVDAVYGSNLNEQGLSMLRRATFSVYLDLRDAGLEAEARALISGGWMPLGARS